MIQDALRSFAMDADLSESSNSGEIRNDIYRYFFSCMEKLYFI
jgi:hypothetical protein